MFDEPEEDPAERSLDPAKQAREKADEFRIHADIAAVFEGHTKFDAEFLTGFDPQLARDIQRGMIKLERSRSEESPVLPAQSAAEAADLLNLPAAREFSTNDYHIHRRPGEVMIARWLAGDQVDSFYERLQAHFDAALAGFQEDERQSLEWKQDPKTLAYLAALDAIEIKMADRYLRDPIRTHHVFVLSTLTADEISIVYLCEYVMGASPAAIVGSASAPPDEPTDRDLAWFYKLFLLRGMVEGVERMCFFAFLQKSDDSGDSDW
ncbi:MAG TPA: hypothetical protein VG326_01250 [Tepidisphaeraceae bacterium]|jgi:hypothetical protein|nr:hypothetical protein [Tepidisphaeraceae bacterium]